MADSAQAAQAMEDCEANESSGAVAVCLPHPVMRHRSNCKITDP